LLRIEGYPMGRLTVSSHGTPSAVVTLQDEELSVTPEPGQARCESPSGDPPVRCAHGLVLALISDGELPTPLAAVYPLSADADAVRHATQPE
jgi:hypothetical protein